MKLNYLYKCTECAMVHASEYFYGDSTWGVLYCKVCQMSTQHYYLEVQVYLRNFARVACLAEKERDGISQEEK